MMTQIQPHKEVPVNVITKMSLPAALLRLEGLTMFSAAIVLFWQAGGSWLLFALLLLVPDIGMLGYLRNSRLGAITYNLVHAYPLQALLSLAGVLSGNVLLLQIGLIWFAHIGMDRTVGYGLKYTHAFKHTHLDAI